MIKRVALSFFCIFFALWTSVNAQEAVKSQSSNPGQTASEAPTLSLQTLLAQTVIFLYEDKTPSNSNKLVEGNILGTAFIVGIPDPGEPGKSMPFIVTAKHVIANQSKILGRYSGKDTNETFFAPYDLDALRKSDDLWEYPADKPEHEGVDIVVFRSLFFKKTKTLMLPIDYIATEETYKSENIDAGDRILIPCLLANYPGITQNYPIFRDGSIALVTGEPIKFMWDFGYERITTKQRIVFVNSVLNEGFSGAPVFLWPGIRLTPKGNKIGGKPWLLGIVHGFQPLHRKLIDSDGEDVILTKPSKEPGDILKIPRPQKNVVAYSTENPGTGMFFPSWQILDILESDAVKNRVKEISEEIKKAKLKEKKN